MKKTNVVFEGKAVYVNGNAETAKVGARGKAISLFELMPQLHAGDRRSIRKQLDRDGYHGLASRTAQVMQRPNHPMNDPVNAHGSDY